MKTEWITSTDAKLAYANGQINQAINLSEGAALHRWAKMTEDERWQVFRSNLNQAATALRGRRSVLYWLLDGTPQGGLHSVLALHNPKRIEMLVEIPEEVSQIPTLLHGLEAVVLGAEKADIVEEMPRGDSILFAGLTLCSREYIEQLNFLDQGPLLAVLPLPAILPRSNVVVLKRKANIQAIVASKLAVNHYRKLLADEELGRDEWRHTMVIWPKSENDDNPVPEPTDPNMAWFGVLPDTYVKEHYDLVPIRRISYSTCSIPQLRTDKTIQSIEVDIQFKNRTRRTAFLQTDVMVHEIPYFGKLFNDPILYK